MELSDILKLAIESKPKEHVINDLEYEALVRNMYQIGG